MNGGEAGRRGLLIPALFALVVLAVLLALGTWQLERKAWKETLIATLTERLAAAAMALPPRAQWPVLDAATAEFRRVAFTAQFLYDQEALVYTSGSSWRADVSGPGYWVFAPARLTDGRLVMVNRGFVPEGRQDPASRRAGQVGGAVEIGGVLRWPEPRGLFTPGDDPGRNLWFVRDHLAIAAAKGVGPVAPFFVDQEAPPAPAGLPQVGPIRPNLPNNHLQYALTWYGLAVVLLGAFSFWIASRHRQ